MSQDYKAQVRSRDLIRALRALKTRGLTFGDCVRVFGVKRDDDPITAAAHERYHQDGEIEIDDTTVRSGSEGDGDYVLAWVWVDNTDAGLPSKYEQEAA